MSVSQVQGIDKFGVRKTSFEYFVDLHVVVAGELSVAQGHAIGHGVRAAILKAKPSVYDVLILIKPSPN